VLLVFLPLSAYQPTVAQEGDVGAVVSHALDLDADSAARVESEVIEAVRRFWAAVYARDSVAVASLIDPDALFITLGVRKNRAELMADFAPWSRRTSPAQPADTARSDIGFELRDFRVIVLSAGSAIVDYVLAWEQVSPLFPSRLFDSHVWVQRDDAWRLVFAHDSVVDLLEFLRVARGGI